MNFSQFAKLIKMDEDELFGLSFTEFKELLDKHGYEVTGMGIFPVSKTAQKALLS
jgi:hypothetical protein